MRHTKEMQNVDPLMLLCAFRYSLGRMTYITSTCADWLVRYWDCLSPYWQKQTHDEIKEAIELNRAGMDCDVASWKRILELPIKENPPHDQHRD